LCFLFFCSEAGGGSHEVAPSVRVVACYEVIVPAKYFG